MGINIPTPIKHSRRPQLQQVVRYSVLLLNVLVITVAVTLLHQSYQEQTRNSLEDAQNLSLLLDNDINSTFDKVDLVLQNLVEYFAVLNRGRFNAAEWDAMLQRQRIRLPMIISLRATDDAGNVLYGLDPASPKNASIADRDHFIRLRDHPQTGLIIARPVLGRTTQSWMIPMARRLEGPDGRFAGVIYAGIPLDHFKRLFASLKLGSQGSIGFRDEALRLIARHPPLEGSEGGVGATHVSENFLATLRQRPDAGNYLAGPTSIDGVQRLHAYRRNSTYGYLVNVGVAEKDFLSDWNSKALWIAIFVSLFILLSVLFVLLIQRLTRDQSQTLAKLETSEARFRLMFEKTADALLLLDPKSSRFVDCNQAAVDMLCLKGRERSLPLHPADLSPPLQPDGRSSSEKAEEMIATAIRNGSHRFEWVHCSPYRQDFPVEVLLTPLMLGEQQLIMTTWRDITQQKRIMKELEHLAQTDLLTGLSTRRQFMALAEIEVSRTARYGGDLSILMMDLDHFKQINDTYGHQTGDIVLSRLGAICLESFRDIDIIGRMGGEEFAVLLPQTCNPQAMEAAERLRKLIADTAIPLPQGLPIRFTLSIGVTSSSGAEVNLDTLLSQADKALYDAKGAGRNRVCAHTT